MLDNMQSTKTLENFVWWMWFTDAGPVDPPPKKRKRTSIKCLWVKVFMLNFIQNWYLWMPRLSDFYINICTFPLVLQTQIPKTVPGRTALTFKGQVTKESSQKVHGVHDKDGDVGNHLHSPLRRAKIREMEVVWTPHSTLTRYQSSQVTKSWLTCAARCRLGGPRGGKQRRKQGWEWCTQSARNTKTCGFVR